MQHATDIDILIGKGDRTPVANNYLDKNGYYVQDVDIEGIQLFSLQTNRLAKK